MPKSIIRDNIYCKIILLFILFSQTGIVGQTFDVTDNKGTIVSVTNNVVTTSMTAPTTPAPNEADIWFDTSDTRFTLTKIYDESTSSWITVNSLSQTAISIVDITAAATVVPALGIQNSTLIVRPQGNGNTSTVSLPPIATIPVGKIYTIKRLDHDGSNIVVGVGFTDATVTINASGAELIDGKTSFIGLNGNSKKVQIQSDGTNWYVIGE